MLPMVNLTENFVIEQSAHATLGEDWLAFANAMLDIAFDEKNDKFKSLKKKAKGRGVSLLSMPDQAKSMLGMGSKFSVVDIGLTQKNTLKIAPLKGYDQLIEMYFSETNESVYGTSVRSVIDKFFAYQWSQKKLLYPVTKVPDGYQRHSDWMEMMKGTELSERILIWFKQKGEKSIVAMYRKNAVFNLLSSTRWHSAEQIADNDLTLIEEAIKKNNSKEEFRDTRTRISKFQTLVINELRYMLIDSGRSDIKSPRAICDANRGEKLDSGKCPINRFEWINLHRHPNMETLKSFADGYLKRLKNEGLAKGTIEGHITAVNHFFRYAIEFYPHDIITAATVDDMFEPNNENNIIAQYTKRRNGDRNGAIDDVYGAIRFLVHCELYSSKARKNTPRQTRKTKVQPYRDAMPREMVSHIVDIIKNRPPNTTTDWSKNKADASWWKFDVYPVFPLMMLFGYFIPLRGEQIRNLCRKSSFVFDKMGRLQSFVVNTDKNVNRKYLQEIPCVWDDLQIFIPFLKWHKEYYPHLNAIPYHDDSNSPWQDIEPLMITPNVLKPMSRTTHANYHKKILCVYQMEVKAKANGEKDYPVAAWTKNGDPFFESIEEIENASAAKMDTIGVAYDIHSLRVTGATRYLESGVGIRTVMELTGHMTPDTLMRIYINLTRDEKETALKSAVGKIYFGGKEDLIKNSSDLIRGELTEAYSKSKESMETAFDNNALFSLHRKASVTDGSKSLQLGTDIAVKKHPTNWIPMIHGICPAVKCPEGREHKCSLCPYLITGKLFLNGIAHRANNALASFYRESVEFSQESKSGYNNHSRSEGLETKLEEILGWQEILQRVEEDINTDIKEQSEGDLALVKQQAIKVFGTEMLTTELAYLKNAYDAKLIGAEQDRYGLKALTIRAMQIAAANGDKSRFEMIVKDETKSIDLLMQYYAKEVEHKTDIKAFVTSLGSLPQKVS